MNITDLCEFLEFIALNDNPLIHISAAIFLAIVAMAGAGQGGAAFAVHFLPVF